MLLLHTNHANTLESWFIFPLTQSDRSISFIIFPHFYIYFPPIPNNSTDFVLSAQRSFPFRMFWLSRSFKEHSVLSRSFFEFWRLMRPKRTERSFLFFLKERERTSHSFAKNRKERKERPVLLQRTGKNAKIVPIFYKERERTRER